jgi:hypothetical protein
MSPDGKRVYYLLQRKTSSESELWSTDVASGKSDPSLPGVSMIDFDISPDGQQVALTAERGQQKQIYIAPLDGSAPPRQVVQGGDLVSFGASDEVIFRQLGAQSNYLARVKTNGKGLERVLDQPIIDKWGVSPGGVWAAVSGGPDTRGINLRNGTQKVICNGPCVPTWSSDGAYLYVTSPREATSARITVILPIHSADGIPALAGPVLNLNTDIAPLGVRVIQQGLVTPGLNPETYVFEKLEFAGNLFRIPLH